MHVKRDLIVGSAPWVMVLGLVGCSSSNTGTTPDTKTNELAECSANPDERTGPCRDQAGLAMCPTKTAFGGDGFAVCEPEPDKGMLIHYGPDDYDDPEQINLFTLGAGDEDENCTYVRTPNEEQVYISSYSGRMRPHSHHLIITMLPEEGFTESNVPAKCDLLDVVGGRWLVGSQEPSIDVAVSGAAKGAAAGAVEDKTLPDYGLAQIVPARTPLRVDLHYVNSTEDPLLREAWVSLSTTEQENAKTIVDMITFFQGQIVVPPKGEFTTKRARCVAKTDRYLGLVTGHAHARMVRESVWHEKADGESSLVYETYNWSEPGELFYRDSLQNPAPDPEAKVFGGASGYQLVKAGEAVSFECEFKNTSDETVKLGETTKTEMCNVFGMYYPTDGDVWNCACAGTACVDEIPEGFDPFKYQ